MSNDQKQQPQSQQQGQTRIPVARIFLRDGVMLQLPGGRANAEAIDCTKPVHGNNYFVAVFVPAHQVIELEWWQSEDKPPTLRKRLPMSTIRDFDQVLT